MAAGRVVPGCDPLEDCAGELLPGGPGFAVEQLELQGAEERFGQRVVVAVADRAHRAQQPRLAQPLAERPGGVLAAVIGMQHR
jgi:hypothetical protein